MFEKYQFEGVYIAIQAVLTLYAQGLYFVKTFFREKKYASFFRFCHSIMSDKNKQSQD